MKTTIKDIARETGLSLATISKYLNHKNIHPKNKRLIEEAIERLDYKPNHSAQTLRSKRTTTIAIIICDLGNYFWGEIINSVTRFFMKYDYTTITYSYYFDSETEEEVIQDLLSQNVAGVIMLPRNSYDTSYCRLQKADIPVVLIDQIPVVRKKFPVDCVTSDNYNGGKYLAEHLLSNGHRKVSILDWTDIYSYPVSERIRGFTEVYHKEGEKPICNDTAYHFSSTEKDIEHGKKRLVQIMNSPQRPSAIFFTNYLLAVGGLIETSTRNFSVPEDISLVAFDDDPLFQSMYPSLTCVAQDLTQLGTTAATILLKRIQKNYSDFPLTCIVDVEFKERNSVKKLKP